MKKSGTWRELTKEDAPAIIEATKAEMEIYKAKHSMNFRLKLIVNKTLVLHSQLPGNQTNFDFERVLFALVDSEVFKNQLEIMADGFGALNFLQDCKSYGLIVLPWDEAR